MTTLIGQFLAVADAFKASAKMTDTTLSVFLYNDWKRIGMLRSGRDQTTRSHEKRLQIMSDNWPADAVWPADVPRPAPRAATTTEAA